MPTLTEFAELLAQKVGLCETGTTSITPDYTTDADAARVLASYSLYDSEGETSKYKSCFSFLHASGQVARCHQNGFSLMELTVFTPPALGTYTLTMNGYGTTGSLNAADNAATVQAAIRLVAGFEDAEVTTSGGNHLIDLGTENPIDITPSAGTVVSRGLGRVRLTRPMSGVLAAGTSYALTGWLPWLDYDGWVGWRSWINKALAQTPFVYRVPLTATSDRQAVFDLAAEFDWLKLRKQVIGLYGSGLYDWTSSFTPPGASTYTLSLTIGPTTYTTGALAFGASADAVQSALRTLTSATGVIVDVTGASPKTISITGSRLWPLSITASAGTINSQATTEVEEPELIGPGGAFSYRNGYPVFEADPFPSTKETRFLACYRRSSTYIAPQTAWDTPGPDSGYASSTTGLVSPSDRAQPDVEQVANLAYTMVCEYLFDQTKDDTWAKKMTRVGQQALYANIFDTQEDRNPGRRGEFGTFNGWQKLPGGGLGYR